MSGSQPDPRDTDPVIFDIFGQHTFGDLRVGPFQLQLEELGLPPNQSQRWSEFSQECQQSLNRDDPESPRRTGPGRNPQETLQDPTTRLCWEELINDPTAHTGKALVEGKHASQQSTGQAAVRSSAPTSTNVSAALGPSKRLTARSLQATTASVTTRAPTQEVLDDFFDRSAARVAAAGRQSELWPGSDSFPGALPDDQMPYNSLWRGKHRFFNSDGSITSSSLAERLTLHTFNYAGLIRFLGFVLVLDPDWRPTMDQVLNDRFYGLDRKDADPLPLFPEHHSDEKPPA
ncbi:hypothetical protein CF319_g6440 [Tilletia indica]|nr:hypothetical protein CF319_g6440 [Tilletia indica]